MYENLKIISYPDPRLKKISKPVEAFDDNLRLLAERMFILMREARGVGLAAPQVAKNIRLFVMNPTGEPNDDRVFVNPVLNDLQGEEVGEEGCLSIPGIHVDVLRARKVTIHAQDLQGKPIDDVQEGYVARIWQHEFDHLNGTLLTDRMGALAKMSNRRTLRELEEKYAVEHPTKDQDKDKAKLRKKRK